MALVKAKLTPMNTSKPPQPKDGDMIEVQFNPATLAVTYGVAGTEGAQNATAAAAAAQNRTLQRTTYSSSLRFDLLFDTSDSNADVRNITLKIAALLHPTGDTSPIVRFSWGTFLFYGAITTISETLDYFSDQGVPLRSSVQLAMSGVELIGNPAAGSGFGANASAGASAGFSAGASAGFSAGASAGFSAGASAGFSAGASVGAAIGTTPLTLSQSGESVQSIAARAGADWKAVANANGIDNPRQIQAGTVLNVNASASADASARSGGR